MRAFRCRCSRRLRRAADRSRTDRFRASRRANLIISAHDFTIVRARLFAATRTSSIVAVFGCNRRTLRLSRARARAQADYRQISYACDDARQQSAFSFF